MEAENRALADENEILASKASLSSKKILSLEKALEKKPAVPRLRRSLTMTIPDLHTKLSSFSLETLDKISKIDLKSNPNIELFLKQVSDLKALCKVQGETLLQFQEIMESTKEDNQKLQNVLIELENDNKGISEMLMNSGLKNSIFEITGTSPVAKRSIDSSMFISTLDGVEIEEELIKKRSRNNYGFIEIALMCSHLNGLKI